MTTKIIPSLLALTIGSLGLGACTEIPEDENIDSRLSISEYEASLMLELVNSADTDLEVLDIDVALNARAATNIIETRNGYDGEFPSDDDVLFENLEDLDAVPYVGASAMGQLRDFVIDNPPPDGELVEGVQFTGDEAIAIVWGVNRATASELDQDFFLDVRAANALAANAPYDSVTEMGPISFVGPHALATLRHHAYKWTFAMEHTFDGVSFYEETVDVALDLANLATFEELTSEGMWKTGATRIIEGRPYTDLAETAAVSGVGTATMQALHDLAAS